MESLLTTFLTDLQAIALDPRKRLFAGYLVAAVLIGVVWLRVRHGLGPLAALRRLFARKVWLGESARADYKLLLLNQALMTGLAPALLGQMTVAASVFYALHGLAWVTPGAAAAAVPGALVVAAFTLSLFVADDLSRYLLHRLLHRVPALWAFHKVHHSARTLSPLTVYRIHPVEGLLFALRSALVQGTIIAAFVFAFGDGLDLATVLGANVLLFAFNAAGSNLRHSHIAFGYGERLERVLMSPAQHQLHHSSDPRHFDCNFGAALSLWDWLAGTHRPSRRGQRLHFGLSRRRVPGEHRLVRLYLAPFAEIATQAHARTARLVRLLSGTCERAVPVFQSSPRRKA